VYILSQSISCSSLIDAITHCSGGFSGAAAIFCILSKLELAFLAGEVGNLPEDISVTYIGWFS